MKNQRRNSKTNTQSILVVDDEKILRETIKNVLQFAGYSVATVSNGEQALEYCYENPPDLVLLDLTMPGISGIETLIRLKTLPQMSATPVVILTSCKDPSIITQSFEAGAIDFFIKPVNWEILKQRISNILHNQALSNALANKEKELWEAQRVAQLGTLHFDPKNQSLELSENCCELLELPKNSASLTLTEFMDRIHPDDKTHVEFTLFEAIEQRSFYLLKYRYCASSGHEKILRQRGEVILNDSDKNNPYLVGLLQDVTETRTARDELEYQRQYDTLTRLYNRRHFEISVHRMLQRPPANTLFLVAFLGIDHFSQTNDSYGHSGGDFVLQEIAKRLLKYSKPGNIICRFGGDIFAILINKLSHIDKSDQTLDEILQTIRQPILFGGHELFVTVSVGASLFPLESEDADALLNGAEAAMMQSRSAGGDRYTYRTVEMNKATQKRATMTREMRSAVINEEFVVFYQPQLNCQTMQIIGMEALIRWQHPTRGFILPGEFIELAEDSGLIIPMGELVLRQACQATKAWLDKGFELRVSVNVSVKQFDDENLYAIITQTLTDTQLPPAALEVEITESMVIDDHQVAVRKLEKLRSLGIKVSMDDFGTGYSSLSQLQQLPLDTVKVDQAFVRSIRFNHELNDDGGYENGAIALAVITMAHSMGMKVIAEGVETEDQLNFLTQQESDMVQGFLFSKPVPAEEFEQLLIKYQQQKDLLKVWRA